jgi:hypothetical protein
MKYLNDEKTFQFFSEKKSIFSEKIVQEISHTIIRMSNLQTGQV